MDLELEKVTRERDQWRDRFAEREFAASIEQAVRAAGGRPDAIEDFAWRAKAAGWAFDPESGTVKPHKDSGLGPRARLADWARELKPVAPHLFPTEAGRALATCTKEQARNPSPELLRAIAAGTVIVTQ